MSTRQQVPDAPARLIDVREWAALEVEESPATTSWKAG